MINLQDIYDYLQNYTNPISILLATISLTYFAYIVFENFYVDYYWYIQLTGIITIGFVLSLIGIICYYIKTYLQGFSGGNSRKYHKFADHLISLYEFFISFCLFSLFVYFVVILLKLEFLTRIYQYNILEFLIFIFINVIIISISIIIFKKEFILHSTIFLIFYSLLIVAVFYLPLVQFSSNLYPPLQGQNTIIMENVYHKNDIQIPITIQITGPKTDLSINLSKKNSDFKLIQIDTLQTLNPDHNPDKITSGVHSILTGNALNDGGYNIFINTTNLTTGYYELTCSRNTLKSYSVNSFYILDNRSTIS